VRHAYPCLFPIDIGPVAVESALASRGPCPPDIDPAYRRLGLIDTVCHHLVVPGLRNRAHRRMDVPLIEGPSSETKLYVPPVVANRCIALVPGYFRKRGRTPGLFGSSRGRQRGGIEEQKGTAMI
jgi:hypothetical protein